MQTRGRVPEQPTALARRCRNHIMLLICALQFVLAPFAILQVATDADTEAAPGKQQQPLDNFALTVDTMFWIGNTEFGERDNWRRDVKPCTLLERIQINEQAVISMGDSMDALGGSLESNIKDLVMPLNGMLLLEESTSSDSLDPLFIQYLNQSGDCFDSSQYSDSSNLGYLFEFEPKSDQMSWFNPDNWKSLQLDLEEDTATHHLIPESHLIPCSDDLVVFGSRRKAIKPTAEANERSETLTFKVNFRPSLSLIEDLNYTYTASKDLLTSPLRVSRLKIANQFYNQAEFEQLISSDQYENILFQFNDSLSLLGNRQSFAYPFAPSAQSLLTIDESSITSVSISGEGESNFCLDEAGCICGNENANAMKAICSFRNPIDPEQLPCYDPIQSVGYCNEICATVMTITMDPTRFKEAFVFHQMAEVIRDDDNKLPAGFADSSIINLRRTFENKYEITLSFSIEEADNADADYQASSDMERQFVELFLDHLDNAKRSFYGIKSVSSRSSSQWKTGNHKSIFVTSFVLISICFIVVFTCEEAAKNEQDKLLDTADDIIEPRSARAERAIADNLLRFIRRILVRRTPVSDGNETFTHYTGPVFLDNPDEVARENSMLEVPLVELDSKSLSATKLNEE